MEKSIPVKQGRPDTTKRCEKKGYHHWHPAGMILDPINQVQKVTRAIRNTPKHTHKVCSVCGLVKEK